MLNNLLEKRWRRAYRIAKFLQLAPYIRMIGVNGSMASGKIKQESDIDFFIITEAGRIWTSRFFITFLTQLTGKRRHDKKIAGRICLNRYQVTKFLEVLSHNDYHARVFSKLVPIFDIDKIYYDYQQENHWMKDFGFEINFDPKRKPIKNSKVLESMRNFFEWILSDRFGNFIEKKLGSYQKKKILTGIQGKNIPAGRVRVSDQELCFHPPKEINRDIAGERWQKAQEYEKTFWLNLENDRYKERKKEFPKNAEFIEKILKKYTPLTDNSRILQIGCGREGEIHYFSIGEKYALDPLADFYKKNFSKARNPLVKYIEGIGENLPYPGNYFDLVLLINVLDHVQNPTKVIKEISRVLKKDGIFFSVTNTYSGIGFLLRKFGGYFGADKMHPYFFNSKSIINLFKKNHLYVLESLVYQKKARKQLMLQSKKKIVRLLARLNILILPLRVVCKK